MASVTTLEPSREVTAARRPAKPRRVPISLLGTVPLYAWLALFVVAPMVLLLVNSFWISEDGVLSRSFSLENYHYVLDSGTFRTLFLKTIEISLAVGVLATVIAFPMAYIVSQRLSRRRLAAVMLVVIPLWVSLLIRVFAWKIILGDSGVLNSSLKWLGLIDAPISSLLYTRFTVFLTLTYVAVPFVFIGAYTALERVPRSVLEASADLGASPWRRFSTVTWPLARQGVAIGFTLAFVLAVGDYLSPSLVGGLNGTMVGSVVVSEFGVTNNWPLGAAMAMVLLVAVIVVTAMVARLGRSRGVLEGDIGSGVQADAVPTSPRLRRLGNAAAYAFLTLAYAFLYLPLIVIAAFSLNDSIVQALPWSGFTTKWYSALTSDAELISAFKRTLAVAVGSVVLSLVLGTAFALLFNYMRVRGSSLLQGMLSLPFLLPGVILGLSLAIVFRQIGFPFGVRAVIVGHATFITPIVVAVLLGRLRRMDPSLVHASMDLGANPLRTLIHVVAPQLRTAFIGAALLGFTLSFDEVLVTFFLTGDQPTLPVYVYNQLRFGFTPTINALFTCIGVGSIALLLVSARLLTADRAASEASAVPIPVGV